MASYKSCTTAYYRPRVYDCHQLASRLVGRVELSCVQDPSHSSVQVVVVEKVRLGSTRDLLFSLMPVTAGTKIVLTPLATAQVAANSQHHQQCVPHFWGWLQSQEGCLQLA